MNDAANDAGARAAWGAGVAFCIAREAHKEAQCNGCAAQRLRGATAGTAGRVGTWHLVHEGHQHQAQGLAGQEQKVATVHLCSSSVATVKHVLPEREL